MDARLQWVSLSYSRTCAAQSLLTAEGFRDRIFEIHPGGMLKLLTVELSKELIWKAQAAAMLRYCCQILNTPELIDCIKIIFCNKKRTTIGTAWTHFGPEITYSPRHTLAEFSGKPKGGIVKFSTKLFERAKEEDRIETIAHEFAHILSNLANAKCVGHGKEWKQTMKLLGYPNASRCHEVDVTGLTRRQTRFRLKCPNCPRVTKISASKRTRWYHRLKKGFVEIQCPECKATLTYIDLLKAEEI